MYDDRKRRVTDLKECSRVTLPKPLPVTEEALIEIRRDIHDRIFMEYWREKTKNGEQTLNLSDIEIRGLRSILKRLRDSEIIIMKTDKSGKFCIVSIEDYLRMGQDHVSKDKDIGRKEVIEIDKLLNGHAMSWCKIWGSGSAHSHEERIMTSKVSKSENTSDLYLLYEDHKSKPGKTRPVVTGYTCNIRAFSNSVSDQLESVAKNSTTGFESISGEDMLSKKELNNEKVKEVIEKWLS